MQDQSDLCIAAQWAVAHPELPGSDRIVLLTLAALPENQRRLTHKALAEKSGTSVSTVQRATKRLKDLGLLAWEECFTPKGRQVENAYALLVGHFDRLDIEEHSTAVLSEDETCLVGQIDRSYTEANKDTNNGEDSPAMSIARIELQQPHRENIVSINGDHNEVPIGTINGPRGRSPKPELPEPERLAHSLMRFVVGKRGSTKFFDEAVAALAEHMAQPHLAATRQYADLLDLTLDEIWEGAFCLVIESGLSRETLEKLQTVQMAQHIASVVPTFIEVERSRSRAPKSAPPRSAAQKRGDEIIAAIRAA